MRYILALFVLVLSGCGTYSPIPSHGGGKRFAVEQLLISSAIRSAVSDIPIQELKDKKVFLEASVISDEGGGYVNGGRLFLSDQFDLRRQIARTSTVSDAAHLSQKGILIGAQSQDRSYVKDISFNSSDSRYVSAVLSSYLIRNNIMINPNPDSEGEADYILEFMVDVLGTWVSKTDWVFKNSENIKAIISAEYVITPLFDGVGGRKVGRVTYEAEYKESYVGWVGPVESVISVSSSDVGKYLPIFSEGSANFNNVKRRKSVEPMNQDANPVIQVNPGLRH